MKIPEIHAHELMEYAKTVFPEAEVVYLPVSVEHQSWRIEIKKEKELFLDIFWGPLSGFGASDILNSKEEDPTPFALYEVSLDSMEAAKKWLTEKK
jgi:hypothetical protein